MGSNTLTIAMAITNAAARIISVRRLVTTRRFPRPIFEVELGGEQRV